MSNKGKQIVITKTIYIAYKDGGTTPVTQSKAHGDICLSVSAYLFFSEINLWTWFSSVHWLLSDNSV